MPAFPQNPPVPRAASPAVQSLQTSSPISTGQELIPNSENIQDMKPPVHSMAPSSRPVSAAANVRILNDVAQARQALAGGTSTGLPSMGGTPLLPNMISSGMASSAPPAQTIISSGVPSIAGSLPIPATGQVAQNSASASFASMASSGTGNSSVSIPQSLSNHQLGVGMVQTIPDMSQGNLPVNQMAQTGMNMTQNMTSSTGASGMPSGMGNVNPAPGMSQQIQPGMQPVGVNNNNPLTNMPLNQPTQGTIQPAQSKYVKVWEVIIVVNAIKSISSEKLLLCRDVYKELIVTRFPPFGENS